MQDLDQLESCIQSLVSAAHQFAADSREAKSRPSPSVDIDPTDQHSFLHGDARRVERSRRQVLGLTSQLQTLLTAPTELIRRLAIHVSYLPIFMQP